MDVATVYREDSKISNTLFGYIRFLPYLSGQKSSVRCMLVKPNGPLTLIGIRGATFISLSFLDQILLADFLSKLSKLFKVKFDINRVILTPYPAYWVFQKLPLGGAKYEHFSFLQSSCQLGLTSLSKQTTGSKSLLTK